MPTAELDDPRSKVNRSRTGNVGVAHEGRRPVAPPFVRSPYNYDTAAASDESGLLCEDPSLAQQHMKDECDINLMVAKFLKTGEMPGSFAMAQFGDFTGSSDYHTALNNVISARDAFNELPAHIRNRFENDPGQLMDFIHDDKNYDEAVTLGLIDPVSAKKRSDLSTPPREANGERSADGVGKSGAKRKTPPVASKEGETGEE